MSEANILYSHSNLFFLAKALSFSAVSQSTNCKPSKANFLLSHGAIFLAIIRASIANVPLPQNGS